MHGEGHTDVRLRQKAFLTFTSEGCDYSHTSFLYVEYLDK